MEEPPSNSDGLQPQDLSVLPNIFDLTRNREECLLKVNPIDALRVMQTPGWFVNPGTSNGAILPENDSDPLPTEQIQPDDEFSNTTVMLSYLSRSHVFSEHSPVYGVPSAFLRAYDPGKDVEDTGLPVDVDQHCLQQVSVPVGLASCEPFGFMSPAQVVENVAAFCYLQQPPDMENLALETLKSLQADPGECRFPISVDELQNGAANALWNVGPFEGRFPEDNGTDPEGLCPNANPELVFLISRSKEPVVLPNEPGAASFAVSLNQDFICPLDPESLSVEQIENVWADPEPTDPESTSEEQMDNLLTDPASTSTKQIENVLTDPESTSEEPVENVLTDPKSTSGEQMENVLTNPESTDPESTSKEQMENVLTDGPESTPVEEMENVLTDPKSTSEKPTENVLTDPESTSEEQMENMLTDGPESTPVEEMENVLTDPKSTSEEPMENVLTDPESTSTREMENVLTDPESTPVEQIGNVLTDPESTPAEQIGNVLTDDPESTPAEQIGNVLTDPESTDPESTPAEQFGDVLTDPESTPAEQIGNVLIDDPKSTPAEQIGNVLTDPESTSTREMENVLTDPESTPAEQIGNVLTDPESTDPESTPAEQFGNVLTDPESTPADQIGNVLIDHPESTPAEQIGNVLIDPESTPAEQMENVLTDSESTPAEEIENVLTDPESTPAEQMENVLTDPASTPAEQKENVLTDPESTPAEQMENVLTDPASTPAEEIENVLTDPESTPAEQMENVLTDPESTPAEQKENVLTDPESTDPESTPAEKMENVLTSGESVDGKQKQEKVSDLTTELSCDKPTESINGESAVQTNMDAFKTSNGLSSLATKKTFERKKLPPRARRGIRMGAIVQNIQPTRYKSSRVRAIKPQASRSKKNKSSTLLERMYDDAEEKTALHLQKERTEIRRSRRCQERSTSSSAKTLDAFYQSAKKKTRNCHSVPISRSEILRKETTAHKRPTSAKKSHASKRKRKKHKVDHTSFFQPQEPEIKLKCLNYKEEKKEVRDESFSPYVRMHLKDFPTCMVVNDPENKRGKCSASAGIVSGIMPANPGLQYGRVCVDGSRNDVLVCCLCGGSSNANDLGDLHGPYFPEGYKSASKVIPNPLEEEDNSDLDPASRGNWSNSFRVSRWNEPCTSPTAKKPKLDTATDWFSPPVVPLDANEHWLHQDCAVWAAGVFLVRGKLYGLEEAVRLAKVSVCSTCQNRGATLGCVFKGCLNKYHYMCAVQSGCVLNEDNFSMKCRKHKNKFIKGSSYGQINR
ncbi:uncharacterized protein LOC143753311 [Siphateles boraxobius]|uniref:uncharacterized protein LOC143753311 n=1 Tax=Siphateles boraxobius TaxID=180520 RepID=UPI00406478EF